MAVIGDAPCGSYWAAAGIRKSSHLGHGAGAVDGFVGTEQHSSREKAIADVSKQDALKYPLKLVLLTPQKNPANKY